MRLVDIAGALKAGRTLYRENWPHYAGWRYDPSAELRFFDRRTHEWFWLTVMGMTTVLQGIPPGLTRDDLEANDWRVLNP
jgi:hypothetical protein